MTAQQLITVSLLVLATLTQAFAKGQTESAVSKPDNAPLRPLLTERGLTLGAAVMPAYLEEPAYAQTLASNFNYLTPENSLKWDSVHPSASTYSFAGADAILAFAQRNGMAMRGHTLVWHNQNPPWLLLLPPTREAYATALKDHIDTVMTHYRGKIRDWDVVNEPLDENGTLRKTLWSDRLGSDYVAQALAWARAADPAAKLFVNDYGTETGGSKSDGFYALIKDLVDRKVPLDGVGFQFHVDGRAVPDFAAVAQNFKRFSDLGLEVQITELDVRLPSEPSEKALAQQAVIYKELLRILLGTGAGKTMITWGVTDKYSWVPSFFTDSDSALLFDSQYSPKPALAALGSLLRGPQPTLASMSRYLSDKPLRSIPPFRAILADRGPTLDGRIGSGEWDRTYSIPLMYNQLEALDQVVHDAKNLSGTLRLQYRGDTIYGLLERTDDVTYTKASDIWANDNFEFFFRTPDGFSQLRTVVGSDWQSGLGVDGKAVWSADGKLLEFSLQIGGDFEGRTVGFLAGLSDNDGEGRWAQVYPVPGGNTGYKGKGFGELTFAQKDGRFVDGDLVGDLKDFEVKESPELNWDEAVTYPFAFDQGQSLNQSAGTDADIAGTWQLLVSKGRLWGRVERIDNKLTAKDGVEVTFQFEDSQPSVLYAAVGQNFGGETKAKAQWSEENQVLLFSIPLPESAAGQAIRWSLGLIDFDDTASVQPRHMIYPWPGYVRSTQDWALGEADLATQMSRKTPETAVVKLP